MPLYHLSAPCEHCTRADTITVRSAVPPAAAVLALTGVQRRCGYCGGICLAADYQISKITKLPSEAEEVLRTETLEDYEIPKDETPKKPKARPKKKAK